MRNHVLEISSRLASNGYSYHTETYSKQNLHYPTNLCEWVPLREERGYHKVVTEEEQ